MAGSAEWGLIVFEIVVMLKLIVSVPGRAFASWMAARRVHCFPVVVDVSHLPSPGWRSDASPVLLTTSVEAATAGVARAADSDATRTMAEAVARMWSEKAVADNVSSEP